jgi:hypothetical protein
MSAVSAPVQVYNLVSSSGSGSGMFYIRGRPSTAIGCGTSAIAFCQSYAIAVPIGTSLTWSILWSHSSVANILANGANDWWYSGWGYPNYCCKVQLFFSSALCDSNSQNTQPEPRSAVTHR